MKLAEHPTVKRFQAQRSDISESQPLDAGLLRKLVLDAGADDVGFVEIDRTELDDQRADILKAFPRTKTLISFVVRMNREPIRTPARSVANLEFHHTGDHVNDVARKVVRTLEDQGKEETVYVLKNSDAENHVAKRFPNKRIKHVGNSLRPNSIRGFLQGVPLVFQSGKSVGLNATYHFSFTGSEHHQATIVIGDKKITVKEGHVGRPDLHVTADTVTWLGFLRGERSIVWGILRRRVRLQGPVKLLLAFGKCFPS